MIDDDLIPSAGTERGLHGRRNSLASIDIANYGAIFTRITAQSHALVNTNYNQVTWETNELLVSRLEEPAPWSRGNL